MDDSTARYHKIVYGVSVDTPLKPNVNVRHANFILFFCSIFCYFFSIPFVCVSVNGTPTKQSFIHSFIHSNERTFIHLASNSGLNSEHINFISRIKH